METKKNISDVQISLPFLLPTLNEQKRKYRHFRVYNRLVREIAQSIRYLNGIRTPPVPYEYAQVIVVRWTSGTFPDVDNLYGSCKPLLDVLQPCSTRHPWGLGLIRDDSPKHLILQARAAKSRRAAHCTQVLITELEKINQY